MSDECFRPSAFAQMTRLVTDMQHLYRERNQAVREAARAHHEALLRLTVASEMRDDDTGVHIVRIGFLAEALALVIGLPRDEAARLRQAAPLHDVGKIGIPDHVLKKAGPLVPEERAVMQRHPELGAAMLGASPVPLVRMARDVALTHHERWDGSGYPRGLAGEQIPLPARLFAVVDVYDAVTSDRPYRGPMPHDEAMDLVRAGSGSHFDPEAVRLFDGLMAERPVATA